MHWVLFDYGNVISLPQPDQDVSALAEAAGCPPAVFANGYWTYRLDYDRAALDATTYWQKIAASAGLTFSSDQLATLNRLDIESWLHLNPQTVQLVDDLAAAGHPLAMLSNAPTVVARAVANLPLVTARFRRCFFSCDFLAAKPDPEIFHAVLAGLDARPGEVTFLDDRADNVAGAAAAGMRAVHFTDAGQARAELARLGIIAEPGEPRPGQVIPGVRTPAVGVDAGVLPAQAAGPGAADVRVTGAAAADVRVTGAGITGAGAADGTAADAAAAGAGTAGVGTAGAGTGDGAAADAAAPGAGAAGAGTARAGTARADAPAAQVPGEETADQAAGLGVPRQVAEPGLGGPSAAPPQAPQPSRGEEPGVGQQDP
jgi:putative hydrolase of the HAD superfamily